ncbi:MAG: hypothetical protein SCK29_07630 [Bacillota bacterium]|nr:hypothetical protein [Bacillota bacterium]MDW7683970.1 hypothetical protein [Bacillota bacterium]
MDALDKKIKKQLSAETKNIRLSAECKQGLQKALMAEISAGKSSWPRRLSVKTSVFWESTYELSLAPLAAACILFVVAGLGILQAGPEPALEEPVPQVYFVSQSDGGMEIIRLSDE